MITSKQILKICELWDKSGTAFGKQYDIFRNPTSSDIAKLKKASPTGEFRYIADAESPKVYVWDANAALHGLVQTVINLYSINSREPNLYKGYCKLSGGQLVSDNVGDYCFTSKKYNNKWGWLDTYIKGCVPLIVSQSK